jgi:E3 ubiquitin-protein ligase HERC4
MLCWGSTKHGQLGLGGVEEEIVKVPVENKFFFSKTNNCVKQIACGYAHTVFLLDDGTVYSCGCNDFEQLGHDGSTTKPEQIFTLETQFIVQIAAGHSFSLALNNKGQVFCWGSISGHLDDEFFYSKPTLIKLPTESNVVQLASGYYFFMMLTQDGKVYVMGQNDYGQLGLGHRNSSPSPTYLSSLQGIPLVQVACGAHHSLVLSMSGNIFAFGKNDFGQLGFGDTDNRIHPYNLKFLNSLRACYVTCGENFSAVLTLDGGVFTFGAGAYGQLGHNGTSHEYLPRKVPDLMGSEISQIACGRCHMLVYVASSNRLYSYGLNGNGQLGIGTVNNNKSTPTLVKLELFNVKNKDAGYENKNYSLFAISAGGDQSFVVCRSAKEFQTALDYRKSANQTQILSVNILEQLSYDQNKLLPSNSSYVSERSLVKALNPTQLKELQIVFSSASCLNASCLDEMRHYDTSTRYPGIDLSKAKMLYNLIYNLNDHSLNELIVERLTKLFESLPESPPSIESLRLYVMAPFLAEFDKIKLGEHTLDSLLFAYAQSINKLKKEAAGRVLDYWFAWTGVEFFRNLIIVYKKIVVQIINTKETDSDNQTLHKLYLKSAMTFLQKLNKINLEFREIVPYDTFYIPEIIDKVDIKKDYIEWIKQKNLKVSF